MLANSKTLVREGRKLATRSKERVFSVNLKSRSAIRTASVGTGRSEGVLVEGTLGILKSVSFLEGVVLELVGTDGVLRVDLSTEELSPNSLRTPVDEGDEGK